MPEDDWRLTWEAEWMHGAQLQRVRFSAPTEDWDHEHCTLCWAKFMDETSEDTLSEGYVHGYDREASIAALEDRRSPALETSSGLIVVKSPTTEDWICPVCFDDFAERFGWTATSAPEPGQTHAGNSR
jgi:hypothetical protein